MKVTLYEVTRFGLFALVAFSLGAGAYTAFTQDLYTLAFIITMVLFLWVVLAIPNDVPLVSQVNPDEE